MIKNEPSTKDWTRLKTVEGLLKLGEAERAERQFNYISPTLTWHPEVLSRRCAVLLAKKKYHLAIDGARFLAHYHPDDTRGPLLVALVVSAENR